MPLTREYLYNLICDNFNLIEEKLSLKQNKQFVIDVFRDSAKFVSFFEKDIASDEDYSFERFNILVNEALKSLSEDSFKSFVEGTLLQRMHERFNNKTKFLSFNAIIVSVFKEIAKYHDKLIGKNFIRPWFERNKDTTVKGRQQTFLSYAYYDKGITLGLYIYFLINDGFLYVNWMWSGVNANSSITKTQLDDELGKSSQLLFLRTLNSELNYYDRPQIRQWCSWEIGNYYTKHKNEKFYVNFYGNSIKTNDILYSFRPLTRVVRGTIS